jgi:hypothetical protein
MGEYMIPINPIPGGSLAYEVKRVEEMAGNCRMKMTTGVFEWPKFVVDENGKLVV